MNQIRKIITGAVAATLLWVCGTEAHAAPYVSNLEKYNPELVSAYVGVLQNMCLKIDPYTIYGMDLDGTLTGAAVVDFEGDNVPELFLSYEGMREEELIYEIWSWDGTRANKSYQGTLDTNWMTNLFKHQNKYYLVIQSGLDVPGLKADDCSHSWKYNFYTIQNGKWSEAPEMRMERIYFHNNKLGYSRGYNRIAGKDQPYIFEQRIKALQEILFTPEEQDKNAQNLKAAYEIPFSSTVKPIPIRVDGKPYIVDNILLDDNNYIELEDIAAVLRTTSKAFDVVYDEDILLVKGKAFSSKHTISQGKEQKVIAQRAYLSVLFFDKEAYQYYIENQLHAAGDPPLLGVMANGKYYIKLRDISEMLDLGVHWDNQTQILSINTKDEA